MQDNTAQARKDVAVDFLSLVVAGRIDEAYRKHVEMGGRHHKSGSCPLRGSDAMK
jgi:hypothetical protein